MKPPVFSLQPGHCTRCSVAFPADAAPFIVSETVARDYLDPSIPRIGWIATVKASVPVCDACLTSWERTWCTAEMVCEGCGDRMFVPPRDKRATCSTACWQRARRARIQRERPPLKCNVCATFFFPKRRADAKYCSNLCRQLAYRLRLG